MSHVVEKEDNHIYNFMITLLMYEMGPFIVAKKAFCNRTAARCLASGAYLASFYHVFLLKNAWKMNSLFL